MNDCVIQATDIYKSYPSGDMQTQVLKGVCLTVRQGEFCAVMGESGSGKSTLLHILGTLDTPTGGELILMGERTANMPDRKKALLRRKAIGFIFQSFYLVSGLTVYENVLVPNLLDRRKVDSAYLDGLLARVGLCSRRDHRPAQLSGGEQQRAAIARALANRPAILLADEPTGNLDSKNAEQILDLLEAVNHENGVTIVMVTHSQELARRCGRIIRMKDGVIA
jgi:putative ABC transport system ATP-binding protein